MIVEEVLSFINDTLTDFKLTIKRQVREIWLNAFTLGGRCDLIMFIRMSSCMLSYLKSYLDNIVKTNVLVLLRRISRIIMSLWELQEI